MRFSKGFKSFEDWLSTQDRDTSYVERIIRLHSLYPKASLDQLRGHAKSKTKLLSKSKPMPMYARSWNTLSPKEQSVRERALEVLGLARRSSRSLTKLCREHGISVKAVLGATNGFKKVNGRWRAKKMDHISRRMAINENGREIFIEISDSRYATTIGRYQSAIKEYLNTGNIGVLRKFKGKKVKDSQGKWHTLDTNPSAILEINARREEPEYYDIYEVRI